MPEAPERSSARGLGFWPNPSSASPGTRSLGISRKEPGRSNRFAYPKGEGGGQGLRSGCLPFLPRATISQLPCCLSSSPSPSGFVVLPELTPQLGGPLSGPWWGSCLRIASPTPTPSTLAFSPLLMLPRWVPRTNRSSQNSAVKGLLYVPGAVGRGLVLSIVQALREGSASPTAEGLTRPEEEGGAEGLTGWVVSGWWLWGGLLAGSSLGWAPRLQSLGFPPLLQAGFSSRERSWQRYSALPCSPQLGRRESGCSIILGLQASGFPPPPSQPQNFALWLQPAADVYPKTLQAKGTFVIFLPCCYRRQGYLFHPL